MATKFHKIEIDIGDSDINGHGRYTTYIIYSNYSADDIEQAYYKATDLLGFNLLKECCTKYKENCIKPEYAKILVDKQILSSDELVQEDSKYLKKGSYIVESPSTYLYIYLDIVGLILSDLQFNEADDIEYLDLNNAGYGLFDLL